MARQLAEKSYPKMAASHGESYHRTWVDGTLSKCTHCPRAANNELGEFGYVSVSSCYRIRNILEAAVERNLDKTNIGEHTISSRVSEDVLNSTFSIGSFVSKVISVSGTPRRHRKKRHVNSRRSTGPRDSGIHTDGLAMTSNAPRILTRI